MGNFELEYLKDFQEYWESLRDKDFKNMYKIDDKSDMSIERERSIKNIYNDN